MAHRTDFPFPQRVIPIDRSGIDAFVPAPDDDIEEFPLLLKLSEVQELIQAAGACAFAHSRLSVLGAARFWKRAEPQVAIATTGGRAMNLRALNHGHPLLPARQLRRRPVTVRLHGIDIVLFRSSSVENTGAFRAVTLDLLMADEITGADDWRGKVQRFPL